LSKYCRETETRQKTTNLGPDRATAAKTRDTLVHKVKRKEKKTRKRITENRYLGGKWSENVRDTSSRGGIRRNSSVQGVCRSVEKKNRKPKLSKTRGGEKTKGWGIPNSKRGTKEGEFSTLYDEKHERQSRDRTMVREQLQDNLPVRKVRQDTLSGGRTRISPSGGGRTYPARLAKSDPKRAVTELSRKILALGKKITRGAVRKRKGD